MKINRIVSIGSRNNKYFILYNADDIAEVTSFEGQRDLDNSRIIKIVNSFTVKLKQNNRIFIE